MLFAMGVRYLFCFTFLLLIHKLPVQSVRVEGVIGQTVTLPCSIKQKPQYVFWRHSDNKVVCNIVNGKADYSEQHQVYGGRVDIFSSETENGNFSIMLRNVMKSDEGTYTCHAPNRITLSVQLNVTESPVTTEKQETKTTTQNQDTTGSTGKRSGDLIRQADILLTFLLACALLYSLVF